MDEEDFEAVEERLKKESGWYKPEKIKEIVSGVVDEEIKPTDNLRGLRNWLEENSEKVSLKLLNTTGGNGTRYYVKTDFSERYSDLKKKLSEENKRLFDELVGRGRSPSGVAAALRYYDSNTETQEEVADEFDIAPMTVRNNLRHVAEVKSGVMEERITAAELKELIGFESGFNYEVSDPSGARAFKKKELKLILDELKKRSEAG